MAGKIVINLNTTFLFSSFQDVSAEARLARGINGQATKVRDEWCGINVKASNVI